MSRLKLAIATTDYDHFRDFRLGLVRAEGIDHNWLTMGHHEIFARFTFNREWEEIELSFAKAVAQLTRENSDIIGLPVVCSRLFRFSSFYVNKKSKIRTAADLKGKRIGSPEWAHTAAVYMRGWLNDEHGVSLNDVHWYQAGANEAGRIEKVELNLPPGLTLTRVADRSLSDMLASGDIDCALIARPPDCFRQGHPDVARLYPDYWEMEESQVPLIPSPREAFAAPPVVSVISNGCPAVSFTLHTPSKGLAASAAKPVTPRKQAAVTATAALGQ